MIATIILFAVVLVIVWNVTMRFASRWPMWYKYHRDKNSFAIAMTCYLPFFACFVGILQALAIVAGIGRDMIPITVTVLIATAVSVGVACHTCSKWDRIARREHPEDHEFDD